MSPSSERMYIVEVLASFEGWMDEGLLPKRVSSCRVPEATAASLIEPTVSEWENPLAVFCPERVTKGEASATSCVGEMSDAKPPTPWWRRRNRVPGTMRPKETGPNER